MVIGRVLLNQFLDEVMRDNIHSPCSLKKLSHCQLIDLYLYTTFSQRITQENLIFLGFSFCVCANCFFFNYNGHRVTHKEPYTESKAATGAIL